jgi:hypothetical protein
MIILILVRTAISHLRERDEVWTLSESSSVILCFWQWERNSVPFYAERPGPDLRGWSVGRSRVL